MSGALLYALSRLGDPEELKANQDLELIWLQLSDIRAQERDMEVIEGTIIPMADEAARILDRAMESGKTELYEVIRKATGFMVLTRLVDNLRFEITGRNSPGGLHRKYRTNLLAGFGPGHLAWVKDHRDGHGGYSGSARHPLLHRRG